MGDLLSKIFDKVAFYEKDGIQYGIEYDVQVEELLEPLRATMSESEVEEIKELVYAASYHAEKYGFMLGVLEVVMEGRTKTIYPDFTILNINTGKVVYLEHAGRMEDTYYVNEFVKKMNAYMANNLQLGRDVILTFETMGNPLDIMVIKRLVQEICERE